MDLERFDLERWQSVHEHDVDINLSESGVHPLRLQEIVETADLDDLLGQELGYTQTNGTIQLEWVDPQDKINKSTHILQREIFKRFQEDPSSCMLFLGFCNQTVRLSPSLGFLRDFSHLFAQRLSHTPDLEFIRYKVVVPLEKNEIMETLSRAPFMTGGE